MVNFHSNPKEGQCQRMCRLPYSCAHFTQQQDYAWNPSSQASAVCESRTSRCTSWIQKKAEEPVANCQHLLGYRKSKGILKKYTSASLTVLKSLTVWITTNCGEFFKRWEQHTTLLISQEACMQDRKQQLEPDMELQTGSKLGKEYIKAVYCHLAFLKYVKCQAG